MKKFTIEKELVIIDGPEQNACYEYRITDEDGVIYATVYDSFHASKVVELFNTIGF